MPTGLAAENLESIRGRGRPCGRRENGRRYAGYRCICVDWLSRLFSYQHDCATAADFEEESPPDKPQVVYRRVITYGIAVMLEPINIWLDERVPAIDHEMLRALRQP
jgi:hypothetical protein